MPRAALPQEGHRRQHAHQGDGREPHVQRVPRVRGGLHAAQVCDVRAGGAAGGARARLLRHVPPQRARQPRAALARGRLHHAQGRRPREDFAVVRVPARRQVVVDRHDLRQRRHLRHQDGGHGGGRGDGAGPVRLFGGDGARVHRGVPLRDGDLPLRPHAGGRVQRGPPEAHRGDGGQLQPGQDPSDQGGGRAHSEQHGAHAQDVSEPLQPQPRAHHGAHKEEYEPPGAAGGAEGGEPDDPEGGASARGHP
mmetsp:Transcript_160/g.407  ORF Transcript_160/g.407 Transcript_160/m.407 type:complete len:251 (+) Transcript_160:1520-2272(+)